MPKQRPTADKVDSPTESRSVRLDKWLWAARFFKTRSLAAEAVSGGRVRVNDERIKPARTPRCGDVITITKGPMSWTLVVRAVRDQRRSAPLAAELYEETAESIAERQRVAGELRATDLPKTAVRGRPSKRDRRRMERLTGKGSE